MYITACSAPRGLQFCTWNNVSICLQVHVKSGFYGRCLQAENSEREGRLNRLKPSKGVKVKFMKPLLTAVYYFIVKNGSTANVTDEYIAQVVAG